jgi:hypothetical protein
MNLGAHGRVALHHLECHLEFLQIDTAVLVGISVHKHVLDVAPCRLHVQMLEQPGVLQAVCQLLHVDAPVDVHVVLVHDVSAPKHAQVVNPVAAGRSVVVLLVLVS